MPELQVWEEKHKFKNFLSQIGCEEEDIYNSPNHKSDRFYCTKYYLKNFVRHEQSILRIVVAANKLNYKL